MLASLMPNASLKGGDEARPQRFHLQRLAELLIEMGRPAEGEALLREREDLETSEWIQRLMARARLAQGNMNEAKTVIMGNEGKIGGHSVSPLVETSEPVFTFGYGVLPFPLMQAYRITRCCNGAVYEVTNIKDDSVSRIVVNVVQLGRPSETT